MFEVIVFATSVSRTGLPECDQDQRPPTCVPRGHFFSVGPELLQVSPKVVDFPLVLDAANAQSAATPTRTPGGTQTLPNRPNIAAGLPPLVLHRRGEDAGRYRRERHPRFSVTQSGVEVVQDPS